MAKRGSKVSSKDTLSKTAKKATKKAVKNADKEYKRKIFVQYLGKEISEDYIYEKFKSEWTKNHSMEVVKSLNVYVKPEDNTAYCVVNEDETLPVFLS